MVLKRIDQEYRDNLREVVDGLANKPKNKLVATFDFLEAWFNDKSFYGCPFVSAAAEYSDRRSQVFKEAQMYKRLVVAYFEDLARAAGIAEPRNVAEQINLLHEGATAVAHITGDASEARKAKAAAVVLLDQSVIAKRRK